jgi:hypothetical protein
MKKEISENTSFNIDLKTLIWIGSLLVTILTGYFTFKSELDSRFDALEDIDNSQVVELEKKFTELENKFTPIGEGVYAVDPKTTWPPSRNEYKMRDDLQVNKIKVLENDVKELKEELKELREKVYE